MSHMLFEIFDFVWQEERIGHESVVNREKSLQSTDNDTENVLFCEMIHQRIAINQSSFHLYKFDVTISQGQAIVKDVSISLVTSLPIAILANHILDCVDLVAAVMRVDHDISPTPIRRLNHTHYLCSSLRRNSSTCLGSQLKFGLLLGCCSLCLLLLLAFCLLFRRDHRRNNVTVRSTGLVRLRMILIGRLLGGLRCAGVLNSSCIIRHRVRSGPCFLSLDQTLVVRIIRGICGVLGIHSLTVGQLWVAAQMVRLVLGCQALWSESRGLLVAMGYSSLCRAAIYSSLGNGLLQLLVSYGSVATSHCSAPTGNSALFEALGRTISWPSNNVHAIVAQGGWHSSLALGRLLLARSLRELDVVTGCSSRLPQRGGQIRAIHQANFLGLVLLLFLVSIHDLHASVRSHSLILSWCIIIWLLRLELLVAMVDSVALCLNGCHHGGGCAIVLKVCSVVALERVS